MESRKSIMKAHTTPNTMIQNTSYNSLNSAGIKSAVSFGIKDTGLAHIFNVLRNQLYTDKIGAVVREYSANAYDANVEAGKPNCPITITMPSKLSKVFKIRDFGRGLSEQDIQEIYCFYGESTKRQSNAFIGQLGLGSKSAFAYGDNFVINSFTDGKVRSYNAFIDPSGIGQIALLSTQDTTDENGVEIVIPVKGEDANYFTGAVKRYLRFFKVRPNIVGMDKGEYDKVFAKPISVGAGWAFYDNREDHRPMAVMGNIAYPIDRSALKFISGNDADTQISYLFNSAIVIDFNIGDLDVAASREGLQYTDRTIANIKSKAGEIIKTLVTDIQKQITQNAKSEYAAKKFMSEMDNLVSGFHYIRQIVKRITFNGKIVTSDNVDTTRKSADRSLRFHVMRYRKNWNGNVQTTNLNEFGARHDIQLVFNDLGHYNAGAKYGRYLASQSGDRETIYLFTIQRMEVVNGAEVLKALKPEQYATYAQQIAELKEANGFCDEDFIFASQINIPVNAVGTTTSKSKRVGALVLDPKNVNSWRNRNAWKDCVVDEKNGNGIYVQINNFHAVINGGDKMVGSSLLDLVQPFKNIDPANIVGFTSTQLKKKMGSGWVRLEDKMQEEFDAFISANKIDIDLLLANRLGNTMLRDSFFYRLQDKKHQDLLMSLIKSDDDRATLRDLFACVNSHNTDANSKSKEQIAIMLTSKIERLNIAAGNASGKNEKAVKIAEEVVNRAKALQKKFPLLSYIEERNMRWGFSADFAKVLSDYMNA
jgi:hypothetical protein